jgi:hypothetical protein
MEAVEVRGAEVGLLKPWEKRVRTTKTEGPYGEVVKQAVKARAEW